MAIAHVQSSTSTNGLAKTFNSTYGVTPTLGNLLVACLFYDETLQDAAALTSAGWTRAATFDAATLTPDGRQSVYAKIAGAAESTTVAWDLGEVNRRAHGYALEFSGFVEAIPDLDGATFVSGENAAAGTSIQVSSSLALKVNALGIAIGGAWNSVSGISWDSGLANPISNTANFRGSAVGWIEGANTLQPTVSWTTGRPRSCMYVELAATVAEAVPFGPSLVM